MNLELSRYQVRRVDQLAMERYKMSGLVLMENAGRNAAEVIVRRCGHHGQAAILCGGGNNGGDGFVIARHLHNMGWRVRLLLSSTPDRLTKDARANFEIVSEMCARHGAIEFVGLNAGGMAPDPFAIGEDEVVVDALLGTGFAGEVRTPTAELISKVNAASPRSVVAIDVPSGLDCDTGEPSNATIRADITVTFVAGKKGFASKKAIPFVGQVEVVGIGVPRNLIEEVANCV
jgi:NAD(P)H-hydrate epimerase